MKKFHHDFGAPKNLDRTYRTPLATLLVSDANETHAYRRCRKNALKVANRL